MLLGHMRGDGGLPPGLLDTAMTGHALALMEALDGGCRHTNIELSFHEMLRHGVVMALDLDVIVDMHACLLPRGVFIGGTR